MNTLSPREFLLRPDGPRRRSTRQALAVIPHVTNLGASPEVNAMDNLMNSRRSDSWSPAPSPDELVIQKRGPRRKSIVWSPDLNVFKCNNLLSLNFKTPRKSPTKSNPMLRSSPRKRLALGDNESPFDTPEKKTRLSEKFIDSIESQFDNHRTIDGLRGLSHNQLVEMIMDLISLQDSGALEKGDKLRDVVMKMMPAADIQPLQERLMSLRQNIFASLISSHSDDSAYSRAFIHLDTFEKAVIDQGQKLLESQHWSALMQYVFMAWNITKELPEWKNHGYDNTTDKCFKILVQFCSQALKHGVFTLSALDTYHERLRTMVSECIDVKICLHFLQEAKHCYTSF